MAIMKLVRGSSNSATNGIASNSLALANGDALSFVSGFVVKATASTGWIIGFANGTQTYAANNQTVAKDVVNFNTAKPGETSVELTTATATLTQAMVGSYFLLNSAQQIDVTTNRAFKSAVNTSDAGVAADIVTDYQFRLIKFITASRGVFMVV